MEQARVLEEVSGFRGRLIEVVTQSVRLPNANVRSIEIVRHPGGAGVLPIESDGRVLLVRQYRHAAREWLLEIPAGKLDGGEPPESCARRELEEETGSTAGRLHRLGSILPAPGYSNERVWLFLGTDLGTGTRSLDAGEVMEPVEMSFREALALAVDGTITDAKTVCALFLADVWIREHTDCGVRI